MKRSARSLRHPLEDAARSGLRDAGRSLARLEGRCAKSLAGAADAVIECLENGGTLYFCGNGGSAADAQHIACEFAGRYMFDRPSLPAISLTTNTSSLTAIGNDYGYASVFARQLEGLGTAGDVLFALTTSGGSASVLRAVRTAHAQGMTVIGFTGEKGEKFAAMCDHALVTPAAVTPRIQEGHIAMGHVLCDLVERALFARLSPPRAAVRRRAKTARPATARRKGRS